MNKQKFVEFIRKPKTLTPPDIEELEKVLAEFPYFQNARAMVAKGSKLNQLPEADKKVATAAVYASDRAFLKKYLTDEIIFLRPLKVIESVGEKPVPVPKSIPKPILEAPPAQKAEEETKAKEAPIKEPAPLATKVTPPPPAAKVKSTPEPSAAKSLEFKIEIDSKPAFTKEDAEKVKEELSQPNDLDGLIEELQHDIEELRKSRARFNEIEKRIEEEDAVEKAVEKATKKTSKKKTGEPAQKEPEKKKEADAPEKKIIDKKSQMGIIENFLSKNPSIPVNTAKTQEKTTQDLSVDSGKFNPEVASEYLAEIFVQQGHKDKALEIYKTLVLKFPDKSAYFADLIKKLDS